MLGYLTATMDMPHRAHFLLLETIKATMPPNSRLIVGLTTDSLAERQKRLPIMNYEQRRDILMATRWVDAVVAHNGATKVAAHREIKFNVCFTGEEYRGQKEYTDLEELGVPVVYLPCPLNRQTSSTYITQQLLQRVAGSLLIIQRGVAGDILELEAPTKIIIKTVRISAKEWAGGTSNVYHLPFPSLNRNWKRLEAPQTFPLIPGLNSQREILIHNHIRDLPFYPVYEVRRIYEGASWEFPAREDWQHIRQDKEQPKVIFALFQKWSGATLFDWLRQNERDIGAIVSIIRQVRDICAELTVRRIIHGDIHPTNLLVRPRPQPGPRPVGDVTETSDVQVMLIDFGWCMAPWFDMEEDERLFLRQGLERNFDYCHFVDSLYFYFHRSFFLTHPTIQEELQVCPPKRLESSGQSENGPATVQA